MTASIPEETPRAAAAFAEYCALGNNRSLRLLAETWKDPNTGGPVTTLRQLEEWSRLYQWQRRVVTYDKDFADAKRRRREEALEEMNEEHARIGREQLVKAVEALALALESGKFGSQALVMLFKYAADLERLARGAATEIQAQQEHTEQVDAHLFQHLKDDPESVRLIARLMERAAAAPADSGVAAADDPPGELAIRPAPAPAE